MDEHIFRPKRQRCPDPPAYEPVAPDPLEAELIAQLEVRGDRHPGEIIEETQP